MRHYLLLAIGATALMGCGGSGSHSGVRQQLAGTYQGTWTNVSDATDVGVSTWTITQDGRITGEDIDVSQELTYTVFGTVDASGNVNAVTTQGESPEETTLTGRLQFDAQGRLTGNLVWASQPPLTYTYRFTRDVNP